jgi:hypothetical protein
LPQIFEFLDQERTGIINLQDIGQTQPEYLEQLDDEVGGRDAQFS